MLATIAAPRINATMPTRVQSTRIPGGGSFTIDAKAGNSQAPSLNQLYLSIAALLGAKLPFVGSSEFGTSGIPGLFT